MSRPRRAAAEVGVSWDRSQTKPATPSGLEPLTPARMASLSSPVNLFGTPRGRPGPGRSLVNEPLFAFLCLFLRLTGLGTLVTGPGKSRGMFVHYLVPLMGLLGLKGPRHPRRHSKALRGPQARSRSCETQTLASLLDPLGVVPARSQLSIARAKLPFGA